MTTQFIQELQRTREYLDYLEDHYNRVQQAWTLLKEIAKDQLFIQDDYRYFTIDAMIKNHDISKLWPEEFVQYRQRFFPTAEEKSAGVIEVVKRRFDEAWEHHKSVNDHHWENWTKGEVKITSQVGLLGGDIHERSYTCHDFPYMDIFFAHMVCDWMAMDSKNGNVSPREYYERNKEEIQLPPWAVRDLYMLCDRLEERAKRINAPYAP